VFGMYACGLLCSLARSSTHCYRYIMGHKDIDNDQHKLIYKMTEWDNQRNTSQYQRNPGVPRGPAYGYLSP
jgi:hypothetical protein